MNNYRFDGHKLFYHLGRVNGFFESGDCYPIYMEISPAGNCNNRCIFCSFDSIGYPSRKLDTKVMLEFIDEIAECKVKSLLYAGEGEPLLHSDIDKFIVHSKNKGIDVGLYTNGQLLTMELAEEILPFLTFLRFSFNGGTKENYSNIHKVKPDMFDCVLKNIKHCSELKRIKKLEVDLGAQYVLLPENLEYLINAVKIVKSCGIDYFVIKPFVQHNKLQSYVMLKQYDLIEINDLLSEAEGLSDGNFKVLARRESFKEYGSRGYKHCYGTSFISVLNSAGDVATCLPYWERQEYVFGNIYKNTFKEIWSGGIRKAIKEYLENKMDVTGCPPNCRPNFINEFLWDLKYPSIKHLNFI